MNDPFEKARDWCSRAEELRRLATETREPAARASLLRLAAAAEHHARTLWDAAIRVRLIRRSRKTSRADPDAAA